MWPLLPLLDRGKLAGQGGQHQTDSTLVHSVHLLAHFQQQAVVVERHLSGSPRPSVPPQTRIGHARTTRSPASSLAIMILLTDKLMPLVAHILLTDKLTSPV
jgi:hypothetical protein